MVNAVISAPLLAPTSALDVSEAASQGVSHSNALPADQIVVNDRWDSAKKGAGVGMGLGATLGDAVGLLFPSIDKRAAAAAGAAAGAFSGAVLGYLVDPRYHDAPPGGHAAQQSVPDAARAHTSSMPYLLAGAGVSLLEIALA